MLNPSLFMKLWAWFVLVITLYTIFFENEKNDQNLSEHDEIDSFRRLASIVWEMIKS